MSSRCAYTNPNPPVTPLTYHLAIDNISNYTVQISGIAVQLWWDMCYPPGAKIKVGGTFVPI